MMIAQFAHRNFRILCAQAFFAFCPVNIALLIGVLNRCRVRVIIKPAWGVRNEDAGIQTVW